MNELTIVSGVLTLFLLWTWLCCWLGEKYDFFVLPFALGIPLAVLFVVSFFL